MHTYKKDGAVWRVGYYTLEVNYTAMAGMAGGVWFAPGGGGAPPPQLSPPVVSTWQDLSEHDSEQTAIDRVNYLNGGSVIC